MIREITTPRQPDLRLFDHSHLRDTARCARTELQNVSLGYPGELDPDIPPYLRDLCILGSHRPVAAGL